MIILLQIFSELREVHAILIGLIQLAEGAGKRIYIAGDVKPASGLGRGPVIVAEIPKIPAGRAHVLPVLFVRLARGSSRIVKRLL